MGVLNEAGSVGNDQMESDSNMYSERENSSGVKTKMT